MHEMIQGRDPLQEVLREVLLLRQEKDPPCELCLLPPGLRVFRGLLRDRADRHGGWERILGTSAAAVTGGAAGHGRLPEDGATASVDLSSRVQERILR